MRELDGRYARQGRLAQMGADGQRRLRDGVAVVIGCGALGTAAAELLVRAGVGRVVIADRDVVELSNLHRQVLFDEADARAGTPKAVAAATRLGAVNSEIAVEARVVDVTADTIAGLLGPGCWEAGRPRVVVDAADNFETRLLVNEAAVRWGWPLVYAGVVGVEATWMTVLAGRPAGVEDEGGERPWLAEGIVGPCLACLMDGVPAAGSVATCESAGVLGSVSAMVGAVQATEAIKCLVGDWAAVERRLVRVDAWGNRHRALETGAARDADCPCCGRGEWTRMGVSARGRAVALCGRGAVQVTPTGAGGGAAALERLETALSAFGPTRMGPGVLRAELVGEAAATGLTVFEDGRTLVHGTEDPAVARSVVARYVGG